MELRRLAITTLHIVLLLNNEFFNNFDALLRRIKHGILSHHLRNIITAHFTLA